MSNELIGTSPSGNTVYAHILNASGYRWNGTAFEVFNASDYSLYGVATVEQGASGIYIGDFPIGIVTRGHYQIVFYLQDGASPANGDGLASTQGLDWDGSEAEDETPEIPGALSGVEWLAYIILDFKRTDKTTSIFAATKDTIDDIRRRRVTEDTLTQATTTDTISVLGDYRINLETDFGLIASEVFLQDDADGMVLTKISKAEFDRKYLRFGTAAANRGRPQDFCLFGGQILVGPIPDLTSYVYVISYSQDPHSEYTSASLSIPYTDKYREIMKFGVLSRLYKSIQNDDQAAVYGTLYEAMLGHWEKKEDRNRTGVMNTRYQGV